MGDTNIRRRPLLQRDRLKVEQEIYEKHEEINEPDEIIEQDVELVDRIRISAMFENVSILDSESLFESLNVIKSYLEEELSGSPNHIRQIILYTFTKSLEDRGFAVKAGALYGMIHGMKIEEETVRYLLLTCIQKELEENNFSEGNRWRFLNAIFLLSELYYHIRFNDHPISVLGAELIKYFRWLLTGDESEIEILAVGLIINGTTLKRDQPISYQELLIEIRNALVTRDLVPTCRSWLLLILDMDCVHFDKLHEDILICHMTFIGDKGFKKLKRVRPATKTSTYNKSVVTHSLHQPQNAVSILMTERQYYIEKQITLNQPSSPEESCFEESCYEESSEKSSPEASSLEKSSLEDSYRGDSSAGESYPEKAAPKKSSSQESPSEWQSPDGCTFCRQCSHDRRHSPDQWRSPDQPDISDRQRSPEPPQHPKQPHKTILKGPRRSSNEYKPNDLKSNEFRCNEFKSNDFKSNDYKTNYYKTIEYKSNNYKMNDYKANDYKCNDFKLHAYRSNDFKSNDFKSSDSTNRPGRSEGRYQHYQPQGNTSQKSYPGKWSTDGAGREGKKVERRIPPWREHDDRFERNYEI